MWELAIPHDNPLFSVFGEVRDAASWVAQNKDTRDRLVHWQWCSLDGERLLGFKFSFKPPSEDGASVNPFYAVIAKDIAPFNREIEEMVVKLHQLDQRLKKLPSWPETLLPPDPDS